VPYLFFGSGKFKAAVASRLQISSMMSLLVSSAVMLELLITLAPSATINGAAARWLSR
jgi:hypothetical protein